MLNVKRLKFFLVTCSYLFYQQKKLFLSQSYNRCLSVGMLKIFTQKHIKSHLMMDINIVRIKILKFVCHVGTSIFVRHGRTLILYSLRWSQNDWIFFLISDHPFYFWSFFSVRRGSNCLMQSVSFLIWYHLGRMSVLNMYVMWSSSHKDELNVIPTF